MCNSVVQYMFLLVNFNIVWWKLYKIANSLLHVSALLNISWKMCNISAMSNFNYHSKTYKAKYAQYLKAKVSLRFFFMSLYMSTVNCNAVIIIVKFKRYFEVWILLQGKLHIQYNSFLCLTDPPELPKPYSEGEDIHLFMPPVRHREGGCSTHHRYLPSPWRHTRQGLPYHCVHCLAHSFRCQAELPWWSMVPHHDLFRLVYSSKFLWNVFK